MSETLRMIDIKVEKLATCMEEMKPLLEEHYLEVHAFPDLIEFNPNYDKYLELEAVGAIHVVTVRDEGKLVGYYLSFIVPNIHYQDHLYASNDVLYVDPAYRGGSVAYRMFKYVEKCYKELGVSVFTVHMKIDLPFDRLCEAIGMEKKENIYMKYIGE
jgi:GNAT superfamily N-acetyltransferase